MWVEGRQNFALGRKFDSGGVFFSVIFSDPILSCVNREEINLIQSPFSTTDEKLSGKQLDSHQRYQQRRKSRTEKFDPSQLRNTDGRKS